MRLENPSNFSNGPPLSHQKEPIWRKQVNNYSYNYAELASCNKIINYTDLISYKATRRFEIRRFTFYAAFILSNRINGSRNGA